jgi:hypothetical protein
VQILDWIGRQHHPAISIICIGDFPDVPGFRGLGQLTSHQLASLFPGRRAVQSAQFNLARLAWSAITAPTPEPRDQLSPADTAAPGFLGAALIRLLEHYPSVVNGLDRTQSQILRVIKQGNRRFETMFSAVQELEDRPFMGDSTLWTRILGLARSKVPAVTVESAVGSLAKSMGPPRAKMGLTEFGLQCP